MKTLIRLPAAIALLCAALVGCGGGGSDEEAPCTLPADKSAFSLACPTVVSIQPGEVVSVTVSGTMRVFNDGESPASYSRYVQISIDGGAYQPARIEGYLPAKASAEIAFSLTHNLSADSFPLKSELLVGFSSIEPLADIRSDVYGVKLSVSRP